MIILLYFIFQKNPSKNMQFRPLAGEGSAFEASVPGQLRKMEVVA